MFADESPMRHCLMLFSLFAAAACSGGSGGGASSDDGRETFVPIIPEIVEGPAGSASYAGQVSLGFTAPASAEAITLQGDLTLQIDFDTFEAAVDGYADGFTNDTSAFTGTLFLSTGVIDDSDGALDFAAQLSGSLQNESDAYLIFGQLRGEFIGNNQEVSTGQVLGTARQAGFDTMVTGQFQAARQ